MADLVNVGPVPGLAAHVGEREAVATVAANDRTPAQLDAYIAAKLVPYVERSYVATQDALNATQTYIDTQDNLRLKTAQKDVANGVPALQADGRISPSRINAPSTQRRPRTPWTPTAYGSERLVSDATEQAVLTIPITDPGYSYRLLVQGQLDGLSGYSGSAPQVNVRVGSTTGTVIASGIGAFESYNTLGGDFFNRTTSGAIGGYWSEYTVSGGSLGNPYCDGSTLNWVAGNPESRVVLFQRIGDDATTYDDYQEVVMVMASEPEQGGVGFGTSNGHNYIYGRMNNDRTQWVRFDIDAAGTATLHYNNGSYNPIQLATANTGLGNTDVWKARFGTASGRRWFQLLRNDVSIINYNDSGVVTSMGANNRGWGIGIRAGVHAFFLVSDRQSVPGRVDQVTINDLPPGVIGSSFAPVTVMPVSVSALPVLTGATTLHVTTRRFGTQGAVAANYAFHNNLTVTAIPA